MSPKQQMLTRNGQLKAERATWFYHWEMITMYMLPRNGRYFRQDHNRGWRRNWAIYDNCASRALEILAAGLMGGLTSPARPWFRLGTPDPDLNKRLAVKIWLHDVRDLILRVFQKSNTYRALHEMYRELGAFGTASSFMADNFDTVIHHNVLTAGEYCIAEDWNGKVCTLYREFERQVSDIVKYFGYNNCSNEVRRLFDAGSLEVWIPMIHAVEPRADREIGKPGAKNMPWKSVYFEIGGDQEKMLRESGFKEYPALSPRWAVAGGDIYGNSPGMECLGDTKQLQQEQLRKAQGIDYQTNPPLQVPTLLKNRDVDRLPGGTTYFDGNAIGGGIKSLFDVNLDLQYLLEDIQDVRGRINASFYVDLFRMVSANPGEEKMTATQIAEMHSEKIMALGPVLERLDNELIQPLVERTFVRLLEAGALPPPPPELHGQQLNIELISMLAQAQKAINTNAIDRFTANMIQLAQTKPDILDKFDEDSWMDIYSDLLGVNPELIVADSKVAAVRKQKAQAQAAQAQAEHASQMADTAQKLGSTPTDGNTALKSVLGMYSGYGG